RSESVWNMYGPTETTIWSTIYRLKGDEKESIPIGKPIDQTQVFVLDKNHQPLPVGAIGELYIGGEGLAQGYHLQEKLTSECFSNSILATHIREKRLYKTGDLARLRYDGNFECLGRIDYQVKIRGFRVELEDIENAIKQVEGVKNTVVAAQKLTIGENKLVGYISWALEAPPAKEVVRRILRGQLPDYMIPSALVYLEEFPLTQNGKIDRKALPEPKKESKQLGAQKPSNELERKLSIIWCDLLQIKQANIRSNFFDLGGNSILLIQVQSEIKKRLGLDIPVVNLFQHPTIESIAQFLVPASDAPAGNSIQSRAQKQRMAIRRRQPHRRI
ncbi:MAG: non-ribosomal peptide synthetase, partial [Cyanothece sp. SIO1E1]|nr:non-ribosomal peptide synthetase [Cyanothece sp. SIO1E1]